MKNIERLAHKKLEEILLDANVVERSKLEEGLRKSRAKGKPLEEILIDAEVLDEETLAEVLCNRLQLPYLSLQNYSITKELIQVIPKNLMIKYQFLPVDRFEEVLSILTASVPSYDMLEEVQMVTQSNLFLYIGKISEIAKELEEYKFEDSYEETITATIGSQAAERTTGWESIFDIANENVQKELKKKGEEVGTFDVSEEESGYEELGAVSIEDQIGLAFGQAGETSSTIEDQISQAFGENNEKVSNTIEDQIGLAFGESDEQEFSENDYEEMSSTKTKEPDKENAKNLAENETGKAELAELTSHLSKNPFDYDAINKYIEIATEVGDTKGAVRQLTLFAWGLDQAGKDEEAVNCYEYILELEPNNREAKRRLKK